jgi:YbgC/YbaW family acyl-CoA thioester hydrolase
MFIYQTRVRLKDTDATGVLYFSEQFKFAMEAFEEFLKGRGLLLKELMATPYLIPVVHAEADYFAPLVVGDNLEIAMEVSQIGSSSITLRYTIFDPGRRIEVGKVQIVHVVIDKETKRPVPIPDFLRSVLESS